jgi:hypothetical protein
LAIELSAYGVEEFISSEGKGHWSNIGRRSEAGRGLRFCYVSEHAEDALAARDAEASEDFSPMVMARLLRVPTCCAEFFVNHKDQAVERYADDYALLTLRRPRTSSTRAGSCTSTTPSPDYRGRPRGSLSAPR